MADNEKTQEFALGLIVAAILFLIFRKEFDRWAKKIAGGGCSCNGGGGSGAGAHGGSGGGGSAGAVCGKCGDGCSAVDAGVIQLPTNPGTTLGVALGGHGSWTESAGGFAPPSANETFN